MIGNFFFMLSSATARLGHVGDPLFTERWRASDPIWVVRYRHGLPGSRRPLWSVVRERLLRPARIAGIAPVVARIAISTAAVDEQCALDAARRQLALEGAYIVGQVLAFEARIVQHDNGACRRCLVVEDRQHGIGWIALEAVAALGPFLDEDIIADVAYNSFRTIRKEDGDR